jgi:hypothetical protein
VRISLVIGLLALGLDSLYASNLLINGGFETASPDAPAGFFTQLATGNSSVSGWAVTGSGCAANCVLLINNNYQEHSLSFDSHTGNNSLDLTGAGNTSDGGVMQNVNLNVGTSYTLSFWVGNMDGSIDDFYYQYYQHPSTVGVYVDGLSLGTFTNSQADPIHTLWQQFSVNFTAANALTNILFVNATTGDNLAGLDDVSLDRHVVIDPHNINNPEPATLGLMGGVLILSAAFRRRIIRARTAKS